MFFLPDQTFKLLGGTPMMNGWEAAYWPIVYINIIM